MKGEKNSRLARASLQEYKLSSVLGCLGALQLFQEFSPQVLRLTGFAALATQINSESENEISSSALEDLIENKTPLLWIQNEDVPDSIFTQVINGPDGSYTFLTGPSQESVHEAQETLRVIYGMRRTPAVQMVLKLMTLLARISKRMCDSAGLLPFIESQFQIGSQQRIYESESELDKCISAVSFSDREIADLCLNLGISTLEIERLCVMPGQTDLVDVSGLQNSLRSRPLVKLPGSYIVASPSSIATAMVNLAVKTLAEDKESTELAPKIHELASENLVRIFEKRGWTLIHMDASKQDMDAGLVTRFIWQFDTQSMAEIVLLSDPITPENLWTPWLDEEELFGKRSKQIQQEMILRIIVVQPLSRPCNIRHLKNIILISMSDLLVVQYEELKNPLFLFQYHIQRTTLLIGTLVSFSSELDLYAKYKELDESFYWSDDKHDDVYLLPNALARPIRSKVLGSRHRHAVKHFDRVSQVEVERYYHQKSIPVYQSIGTGDFVIEPFSVPTWITYDLTPQVSGTDSESLRGVAESLVVATAFWMCKISGLLEGHLVNTNLDVAQIAIQFEDDGPSVSESKTSKGNQLGLDAQSVSIDFERRKICVKIREQAIESFAQSDNHIERELMLCVLHAYIGLLQGAILDKETSDLISEVHSQVIPLGPSKMVLVWDGGKNPELQGSDLPFPRRIQAAEYQQILDEIGVNVRKSISIGPIPPSDSVGILNAKVVGFLYSKLEEQASYLSDDGLLQFILLQHEAIVTMKARNDFERVPRLACFGPSEEAAFSREQLELTNADIAARFLIEFLGSRKCSGRNRISLQVFDRLLALCWELFSYGQLSDLLNYGLVEIGLSVLPSGRLGLERTVFERRQAEFFGRMFQREQHSATDRFGRFWSKDTGEVLTSQLLSDADPAILEEFGISLFEMKEGLSVLFYAALKQDSAFCEMEAESIVNLFYRDLGWNPETTRVFLGLFALGKRDNFLKPPDPFREFDVYPWRFNRRLSYLRRPLVPLGQAMGLRYCWTARHLRRCIMYLYQLVLERRLPLGLPKDKSALAVVFGKHNKSKGRGFEQEVASLLSDQPDLWSLCRVKKIGGHSVGPVGDIDMLVFNLSTNKVFVCECKDLYMARTPYEMRQQYDSIVNADNPKGTAVQQLERKVEWLRPRIKDILEGTGISYDKLVEWEICGIIVVSNPMFVTNLRNSPVPVLSTDQLAEHVVR